MVKLSKQRICRCKAIFLLYNGSDACVDIWFNSSPGHHAISTHVHNKVIKTSYLIEHYQAVPKCIYI